MATKVAGDQYYDLNGQLLEIMRQLRQPNGYKFDPEQLKDHLQLAIEGKFLNHNRRFATVNYNLSLKEMIAACNLSHGVEKEITEEMFPVKGSGFVKVDFSVIDFDRIISYETMLGCLDIQGLRPAKIEELLAYLAKYSNEHINDYLVKLAEYGDHILKLVYNIHAFGTIGRYHDVPVAVCASWDIIEGALQLSLEYYITSDEIRPSASYILAVPK
jgi:hypothetical protein